MKRNLTVQLDDETVRKAKVLAARRSTSVSKLVAHEIARLVTRSSSSPPAARAHELSSRRISRTAAGSTIW